MSYRTPSERISEHALESYFVRRVAVAGGIAEKFTSPGRRGVPDRVVMWTKGRVDFVELKTPTGRLTRLQTIDHSIRRRMGHWVYVLRTEADVDTYVDFRQRDLVWLECQT